MLMFIANISISNNLYIVRILFLFFAFFLGRRCKFKLYFPIQRRQFRFQTFQFFLFLPSLVSYLFQLRYLSPICTSIPFSKTTCP